MRRYILLVVGSFLAISLFGQKNRYIKDDTTKSHHSKTDFSEVDTLDYWKFSIDTLFEKSGYDSIRPIAKINFSRTVAIDDGISPNVYGRLWTPFISFYIYNREDIAGCKKISRRVRIFSSCVPPDVGGDLIVLGDLILLNRSVCVSCIRFNTRKDYCRPLLNKVFSQLDDLKVTSVSALESQIEKFIQKG